MLPYAHLKNILYIFNATICIEVNREKLVLVSFFKVEATCMNNLFLNLIPLSDKKLCDPPHLE